MNKQDFIAQLDRGAATLAANPVSAAVLKWLAQALKTGEPEWWKLTQKAWEKRSFVAWNEAWGLFLTAMHFEALSDSECPLVPFFPSCGGTDEAEPGPGVARFLPDAPDSFYEHLAKSHRRPVFIGRSRLWLPAASVFFQSRQLPFYIVQVNAGGGLDLIADLTTPATGLTELVSARIGLDVEPLELEDLNHRRWQTAAILPDDSSSIAPLDAAIELLLEGKRRDPNFVQLVACAPEQAAKFITKNIPYDDEEVGLLVLNVATTGQMADPAYGAYSAAMTDLLKRWGNRGLWLEVERVRGELYSTTYELRAAHALTGAPALRVLARFDAAAPVKPNVEDFVKFLLPPGALYSPENLLAALPKA